MSKFLADNVRDKGLEHIVNNANDMHICNADPADRAAVLVQSIGNVPPTFDAISGTGTRLLTSQQKAGVAVSADTAATVNIIDAVELLEKTDVVGTPAVAGTVTINAFTLTSGSVV